MANFVSCNNYILDINTLLKSLFSVVTATDKVVLRTSAVLYGDTLTEECARDSFETLLRRSICVAEDSKPAIRFVQQTHALGGGLQDLPCDNEMSLDEIKRQVFCRDTNGNIAIQSVQIPEL